MQNGFKILYNWDRDCIKEISDDIQKYDGEIREAAGSKGNNTEECKRQGRNGWPNATKEEDEWDY